MGHKIKHYFQKVMELGQGYIFFRRDMKAYKRKMDCTKLTNDNFRVQRKFLRPCYWDRLSEAGSLDSYFWQDLWCARHIYEKNPIVHYDIGSRVDGFIGHLASFRKDIILIDVRPLSQDIPGVSFIQEDATALESFQDNSIPSISALCSLEHFGLGRYGDDVDPDGCFRAFQAIKRVLSVGGNCYIAVPVGKERVEFNAHRIFYPQTVVDAFSPLKLEEFSTTCGTPIIYHDSLHKYNQDTKAGGGRFGLFHFVKEVSC